METIEQLMLELDGADADTVNRIAWEKGSLPVRLAMLGLAATRKAHSPLWFGYPPGVFISYKWAGEPMRELVMALAGHVRGLGYRAFLDVESLDEEADAYFQIPSFIASLQDCTFYVLLLTKLSADLMTARRGKTSWIHDEYQHAVRLVNMGRLVLVPVLLEPGGETDSFTRANSIDLTSDKRDFARLEQILTPAPLSLAADEVAELAAAMSEFDSRFLGEDWDGARGVLASSPQLAATFDHQFRQMLLSMYTADQAGLEAALGALHPVYGEQLVYHLYAGYCEEHGIPNQASTPW
jgi:TIR domain